MKTILIALAILAGIVIADLPAQAGMCTTMCGPVYCTTNCF